MNVLSRLLPLLVLLPAATPSSAAPAPAPAAQTAPAANNSGTAPKAAPAPGSTPTPANTLSSLVSGQVGQRGNDKLTIEEVRDFVQNADPGLRQQLLSNPAALSEFVRDRLLRMALLDQAKASGFDRKPEVLKRANEAHDNVVVSAYIASLTEPPKDYPSDAEVASIYDLNKQRFVVPRQYHISQIAVRLPVGSPAKADDEAKAKINDIYQQLTKKKANFAEMAQKNSDDNATKEKGGDLGWVREDQLVPAVKDTVGKMQDNTISEPIRTPEGWHIVRLSGIRPSSIAPLADVKGELAQALRQQRMQQNAQALVAEMLRKEPVQINELELSRSISAPK